MVDRWRWVHQTHQLHRLGSNSESRFVHEKCMLVVGSRHWPIRILLAIPARQKPDRQTSSHDHIGLGKTGRRFRRIP